MFSSNEDEKNIVKLPENAHAHEISAEEEENYLSPWRVGEDFPNPRRRVIMSALTATLTLVGVLLLAPIPFGNVVFDTDLPLKEEMVANGILQEPINIFQIKTSTIKNNLQNDYRIASVKTSYEFPSTLKVHITKREAVAILMTEFGYADVDAQGQCIKIQTSIGKDEAPIISGIKLGNVLLGDYVKNENVDIAIKFLDALGSEGRKNISEINMGNPDDIIAFTSDGLKLKLGNSADIVEKAKLALNMIRDVRNSKVKVEYIDVNLTSPYIKTTK